MLVVVTVAHAEKTVVITNTSKRNPWRLVGGGVGVPVKITFMDETGRATTREYPAMPFDAMVQWEQKYGPACFDYGKAFTALDITVLPNSSASIVATEAKDGSSGLEVAFELVDVNNTRYDHDGKEGGYLVFTYRTDKPVWRIASDSRPLRAFLRQDAPSVVVITKDSWGNTPSKLFDRGLSIRQKPKDKVQSQMLDEIDATLGKQGFDPKPGLDMWFKARTKVLGKSSVHGD
jgi:hypothetical protein